MPIKDILREGWQSLVRNRLRSFLTMLGIVWGLTTVILLLAYGQGVGQSIVHAFLGIGNNVILSWGGQTSMQAGGERSGKKIKYKYEDLQAVRDEVPLVNAVSGETDDTLGYKFNSKVISIQSKAIQFPYGQMRKLIVDQGRYFEEADFMDRRRVLIFGPEAAKKVFGSLPPVGQRVQANGQMFDVIGVLQRKIQDSSNNGPDNENVFLPFETYREIVPGARDPQMIVFQPNSADLHLQAQVAVRAVLAQRHGFDPRDDKATLNWDTVEDAHDLMRFSRALEILLGVIGALTLGVGGVGVMNIMLVSVTERTREIGLRKALGAKPSGILLQFLLEALVLTLLGGVLGILVALLLAHTISPMPLYSEQFKTLNHEGDIVLRTSPLVMISSFAILGIVAILSGFWPALKAANMDPVEALRYE